MRTGRIALCALWLATACDESKGEDAPAEQAEGAAAAPAVSAELQENVDSALAAVASQSGARRSEMLAAVLAEVGEGRYPKEVVELLRDLMRSPPEYRRTRILAAFAQGPIADRFTKVCKGNAGEVLGQFVAASELDQGTILFEGCDLGRHGLVDAGDAKRARPTGLLLAHAVYAAARDAGPLAQGEGDLIRALAVSGDRLPLTPGAQAKKAEIDAFEVNALVELPEKSF